jgi:hypothetical protein
MEKQTFSILKVINEATNPKKPNFKAGLINFGDIIKGYCQKAETTRFDNNISDSLGVLIRNGIVESPANNQFKLTDEGSEYCDRKS